ncbi:DUF2147 domain-containing protein [Bradyrhizobium sp. NL2]|uniref:DUF2147 domain-containing protein n=1 Tax=Bradyrhizobium sp. NL2 TaxID=3082951 RepID=UPI00315DC8AB
MRKLLATAAFLLASTAAQAQYTFEYGGRTIRIDPDRGTVQIPGVYDNTGQGKAKKAKKNETSPGQQAPQQAKVDPQPQAAPAPAPAPVVAPPATEQAPAAAGSAPARSASVRNRQQRAGRNGRLAATRTASGARSGRGAGSARRHRRRPRLWLAASAPRPAPAWRRWPHHPGRRRRSRFPAGAPARDLNSPLGIWLTEEKEGKVRIEQCGSNLCGYSVDSKSNQNGEQVLINMKPAKDQNKDQKWSGRILDPNTGSTYDSTIAMKGTDRLRVQGCAFGGMFCGGQTWTRVN